MPLVTKRICLLMSKMLLAAATDEDFNDENMKYANEIIHKPEVQLYLSLFFDFVGAVEKEGEGGTEEIEVVGWWSKEEKTTFAGCVDEFMMCGQFERKEEKGNLMERNEGKKREKEKEKEKEEEDDGYSSISQSYYSASSETEKEYSAREKRKKQQKEKLLKQKETLNSPETQESMNYFGTILKQKEFQINKLTRKKHFGEDIMVVSTMISNLVLRLDSSFSEEKRVSLVDLGLDRFLLTPEVKIFVSYFLLNFFK